MTDIVLETLIKSGADPSIIEQYVRSKQGVQTETQLPKLPKQDKPKRKLSEKQLAALAAGRAKNPRLIAKQKRLEEEAAKAQEKEEEQK